MTLKARHRLHDYTGEIDFATRRILQVAGSQFAPVWNDLDKGTGHVCVAGRINGHPLMRFYKTVGEVSYATVPIDADNSQVNANGRISKWEPAGQILLEGAEPDVRDPDPAVQKGLAFLRQLVRGYEPIWIRPGTTWPVALLRQRGGSPTHWAFVEVPTRLNNVQQAVVDLCLTTEQLLNVMPDTERRAPPPAF